MIRFAFDPTPSVVELSIEGPSGALPVESWSLDAPDALLPGVDLAHRLLATDKAVADTDRILVEHLTIAALSSREAASIGLPPQTEFVAQVQTAGRPGLDTRRLAAADWVLTTYETLRNFDRDFGLVRFAVLLFDEAQKIKTPGIRLTDAAKAMNAEFRIAMTGTPVENRLSDIWCIADVVSSSEARRAAESNRNALLGPLEQ